MVAKVAGGVIAAFLIFYIVVSPDNAAEMAKGGWHLVERIAGAMRHLVDKLAS